MRKATEAARSRSDWVNVLAFMVVVSATESLEIDPVAAVNHWLQTSFRKGGQLSVKFCAKQLRHELARVKPRSINIMALTTLAACLSETMH